MTRLTKVLIGTGVAVVGGLWTIYVICAAGLTALGAAMGGG